ncbi:hypothetical protein PFISCL1PPCAC_9071, partial [Pristionchus fissidentatus]
MEILFVRLAIKTIPNHQNLHDDMLPKNLDEKCNPSLNGVPVWRKILQLVPKVDTFTLTLRTRKVFSHTH